MSEITFLEAIVLGFGIAVGWVAAFVAVVAGIVALLGWLAD